MTMMITMEDLEHVRTVTLPNNDYYDKDGVVFSCLLGSIVIYFKDKPLPAIAHIKYYPYSDQCTLMNGYAKHHDIPWDEELLDILNKSIDLKRL